AQIRAARCTPRPTYRSPPTAGSPVWMPIRTCRSRPFGQAWSARAIWPSIAAATASLALTNAVLGEGFAQDRLVIGQGFRVAVAQLFQEPRRPFDVREKERDSADRKLCGRAHRRVLPPRFDEYQPGAQRPLLPRAGLGWSHSRLPPHDGADHRPGAQP